MKQFTAVRILVSVRTKSKYSIVKYISIVLVNQNNFLTKEITPKNIFYRNEVQYRDDVPTKRKVEI